MLEMFVISIAYSVPNQVRIPATQVEGKDINSALTKWQKVKANQTARDVRIAKEGHPMNVRKLFAIVTYADPFGCFRNVGMNYRGIFEGKSPDDIKRVVREAKFGGPNASYRLEYFYNDSDIAQGRDPIAIEYLYKDITTL